MSEQVSPSLIKETQDALSKYVKKPPLNEKLLSKPPFRYLHDIVTAVIKETGFLDGVFTAEELDSNNVKDKESKILFLNKLISAVKSSTGKNVTVRAAKIVAGLEVNKTLELLQIIGKAIDEKFQCDATKNVAQLPEPKNADLPDKREDEKEKKIKEKVSDVESKESRKVTDKVNTNQRKTKPNEKEDAPSNRRNSIEKSSTLKKAPTTKNTSDSTGRATRLATNSEAKTTVPKPLVKRNSISNKSVPIRKPSLKDNKQSSISKALPAVIKEEKEESNDVVERKKEAPEKDNKAERKNVSKNTESRSRKEQDNLVSDKEKENESMGNVGDIKQAQGVSKDGEKAEKSPVKRRESVVPRPGSARPGSRKMAHDDDQSKTVPKETAEANGNDPKNKIPPSIRPRTANRPASARPGAPRIRDRGEVAAVEEPVLTAAPVNVIEEGKQDQFMDDRESFIVIEDEKAPLPSNDTTVINETEQGQLVHQILKTQKELNESVVADRSQNKQPQIEWEAGRQAEKEMISEEIEKIRKSIQALTSAANPLGKLFDFLQEDVDEMQRELQHWKNVNEKLQKQQQSELELGKTLLQPLQKQLSDVENSIDEEYSQIANIKMAVLNNDEKILKLATSNGPKIRIK